MRTAAQDALDLAIILGSADYVAELAEIARNGFVEGHPTRKYWEDIIKCAEMIKKIEAIMNGIRLTN